jgi:hypothetical protein
MPAHDPAGAPRLRLLTYVVSVRGALGSEAQTFIRQISARVAGTVPYRLLDESSWATQGCAPLFRSAITFAARRALAAGILRMCVFSANLYPSIPIKGSLEEFALAGMRRPNNHSTTLGQLADPVLHFGFIQDADYTVVIPSSLAFHAAKEAKIRARLLPNERRFPPKNPARLREQLTTVHISPHGDAADFHGEFKRLVGLICGFPGRVRLLIGSTDRWWPKHYSRDAVDQLYDASRCPSIVSVRAQNLHAAFLRPQQAKRTGMLPIGLPPLSNWTKLPLSKASPV